MKRMKMADACWWTAVVGMVLGVAFAWNGLDALAFWLVVGAAAFAVAGDVQDRRTMRRQLDQAKRENAEQAVRLQESVQSVIRNSRRAVTLGLEGTKKAEERYVSMRVERDDLQRQLDAAAATAIDVTRRNEAYVEELRGMVKDATEKAALRERSAELHLENWRKEQGTADMLRVERDDLAAKYASATFLLARNAATISAQRTALAKATKPAKAKRKAGRKASK